MSKKSLTTKILEYLHEFPGAGIKDIASALGINAGLARAIIYKLKSKGLVEKAGNGYVLTTYAEESIAKQLSKAREEQVAEIKEPSEESRKESLSSQSMIAKERTAHKPLFLDNFNQRIIELERQISRLENELVRIRRELERLREEAKKFKIEEKQRKRVERLPKPIMSVAEAQSILGDQLSSLIYTGKAVVIGSLIVDHEIYDEFISKLPLSRKDAEKLPEPEKLLLEEMKKEGRIYLHAGKVYKLV